jgi:hypothetical protein
MDDTNIVSAAYQVPTYRLDKNEAWYHFLYGNVPAHQIDFIYRPEVPQEPLTRQHFMHLSRIVKYIEPRPAAAYSFAIANLSRDDTQFEPGHGGVAFVFGLRIKGARDHAGRQDPPFCHSAAVVDRHLDAQSLYGIAVQFYQKLLPDEESQAQGSGWYHTYVAHAENSDALVPLLKGYLADFADLLVPEPGRLGHRWTADNATAPKRVVVVYPDRADFATIAYGMARIAAVLIESDIKWTAISNGREHDVAGGLTVRFIPQREVANEPTGAVSLRLEHLPDDPAEIAAQLFHAYPMRRSYLPEVRVNHPPASEMVKQKSGVEELHVLDKHVDAFEQKLASETVGIGGAGGIVDEKDTFEPLMPQPDPLTEVKKKQRKEATSALIGLTLFILVFGAAGLIWVVTQRESQPDQATGTNLATPEKPNGAAAPIRSTIPSAVHTASPVLTNVPSTSSSALQQAPIPPTSVNKGASRTKSTATPKNPHDVLNQLPPMR